VTVVDVLSDVVTATRTGRPLCYLVECHGPWGRRYASVPGAGIHVVLEGSAWLLPREGSPVHLAVGDVLLLPSGIGHALADAPETSVTELLAESRAPRSTRGRIVIGPDGSANGRGTLLLCGMFELDHTRSHPLFGHLPEVVHLPGRLGRHQQLLSVVDLLAGELLEARPGSDAAVTALLDLLLIQALRAWHTQSRSSPWSAALADGVVSEALRCMHDRPDSPWSVGELAALSGSSRASFAKRFKELVGQPPLAYLTWWRMALAAQLLQTSDLPLARVAARVGYATEYTFATAFKRELGMPPGAYRRGRASTVDSST
jgi:AraC-like DNA-binding protein